MASVVPQACLARVTVPHGVGPGDVFQVAIDRQVLNVQVPPGVFAGSMIDIPYTPLAAPAPPVGTLDYSGQGLHVDGGTFIVAELLKENTSVTNVSN